MKDKQAEQFTFTDKDFSALHFEDDGHELELNGNMYDIIKIEQLPGKKIIHCLKDTRETDLIKFAKKHFPQKNTRNINNLSKIYLTLKPSTPILSNFVKRPAFPYFFHTDRVCSISYDILKPPPDLS